MASRINSHSAVASKHHPVSSRTLPGNQVDIVVGQNISSAREAKRMSFVRLAQEAKINPDVLAAYEKGSTRPAAGDLLTIATCLGVPASEFFTGL